MRATDNDSDDVTGPLDDDDTYTYAVTTGALPPGLTLNIYTANIFGTPTAGGSYSFTITATNTASTPSSGSQAYTLVIGTNTLTLSPASLPNGTVGTPYDQGVTASGGSGTYSYFVSSGALPAGLTLNPNTGTITGVPTASGPASFTIEAVDPSTGNFATHSVQREHGQQLAHVQLRRALPNGTHGVAYSQTVTASGGTGPYTYAVSAGTLPAGLTLNSSHRRDHRNAERLRRLGFHHQGDQTRWATPAAKPIRSTSAPTRSRSILRACLPAPRASPTTRP